MIKGQTEVCGKANIVARVICDSVSPGGVRLTTFELEYPRIIHSELMTHRMLSRNAASSRAIPFEKMLKQLNGRPVRFGAANNGMQDTGVDFRGILECVNIYPTPTIAGSPEVAWDCAKNNAVAAAKSFYEADFHKQVYNRLLEPFQMMKTVVTATEWNNFFHLRLDSAADPTIYELARCMKEAMEKSVPQELQPGEWHLPYVLCWQPAANGEDMFSTGKEFVTLEQAIKVSAARCAAVSFRNEDYGLEKCLEVYGRLVGDERVHASALEHQATPMRANHAYKDHFFDVSDDPQFPANWEEGVTHMTQRGDFYSGNFRGWLQHRQLVPNHVKEG